YMKTVTESSIIGQVKSNLEVKVSLIPDSNLLAVKQTLDRLKHNLQSLLNEELMVNDGSYDTVEGSADGAHITDDVPGDDEDMSRGPSGDGSGSGDGMITPDTQDEVKTPTPTTTTRHPHIVKTTEKQRGSAVSASVSVLMLLACGMLAAILSL
ncbi:uncharacterized protein LOC131931236, partial [Physella acuta]|uniref:uncharacterized protein LOC131931236 n=1 Tax=Physella acuta TaxID=109671 RepID=UPI0027DDAC4E